MPLSILLRVLSTLLLLGAAFAANDRGYCGAVTRTQYFFSPDTHQVRAINIRGVDGPSDLLHTDASTTDIYRLGSQGELLGGTTWPLPGPAYCLPAVGTIHIADINGDGNDDIVCQLTVGGTLTARLYSGNGYEPEKPITSGFACDASTIYIGDFDGNGAEDFLCVNAARDDYKIYFNLACNHRLRTKTQGSDFNPFAKQKEFGYEHYRYLGYHHHSRHGFHDHNEHDYHHHFRDHKYCGGSLPIMKQLIGSLPCSATTTDSIVIADVNGDKASDILCHSTASNDVAFVLSSSEVSDKIFNGPSVVSQAGQTCVQSTSTLLPSDVDGDGDQDIVCVIRDANNAMTSLPVAYVSDGDLQPFSTLLSSICFQFCTVANGATPRTTRFSAGDFNGDGYDDVICRLEHATWTRTDITFSHPPALA